MAAQTGTIVGMQILKGDDDSTLMHVARVHFTIPAFGSSDTFTIPVGAYIATQKRNGATITLNSACAAGVGTDGTTSFYPGAVAKSTVNVTGTMLNLAGSGIAGASGVGLTGGIPMSVCVCWTES